MPTRTKLTEEQKQANRLARKERIAAEKEVARIEREKNQKPVRKMTLSIEWKKSRMWGNNPRLSAEVYHHDGSYSSGEFTCSGCGYDKESTVISEAFNAFLKYKLYGELKPTDRDRERDGEKMPYGIYTGQYRHFSGGIGTDCYYPISEAIGGKFTRVASGKTYDCYVYTDNEPAQD